MSSLSTRRKAILAAIFILALTAFIAGYIYYGKIPSEKKIIGVIEVYGYIIFASDREVYLKAIETALRNESIAAVVVTVDSGGGLATTCEEIYSSLRKLSEKKPVVISISGIAASGGYYIALGGDYIIATSNSLVGNIGVISYTPPIVLPPEYILETGAFKYTGFSTREFPLVVKAIFSNFLEAVNESRGDKLNITYEELTSGKLFLGKQALELGLIDSIGSYFDALDKAAELAGIEEYEVVDLTRIAKKELGIAKSLSPGQELWVRYRKIPVELLANISRQRQEIFYIPPYMVEGDISIREALGIGGKALRQLSNITAINATNRVAIDLSHENFFFTPLMMEFLTKIIEGGDKVYFITQDNLVDVLEESPKALVIFTPFKNYERNEIEAIKRFVTNGGKLFLAHDPSVNLPTGINQVAQEFGIMFETGYLYNPRVNYGVYRNIVVEDFAESNITRGVERIVILTGTAVYGNATVIAYTSNDTYLSIYYRKDRYPVIVEKGSVLAIGDITSMMDQFLELGDNRKLLYNIIEWLRIPKKPRKD